MTTVEERLHKIKQARCHRCGHEEGVAYKDRRKKVCPKCFTSESILEIMYLVPSRFFGPEEVTTIEADYTDWIDKDDGYIQEKLQK